METPTLQDYQNLPISQVFLSMIIKKKVPRGMIPPAAISPIAKFKHHYIRLDLGAIIDATQYLLASTRPISDYYSEGQYKFYMEKGHVSMKFDDFEPYNRYVEFAGKNFDNYVKRFILH